jgi:uncharacterized protein (DUF2235 family)
MAVGAFKRSGALVMRKWVVCIDGTWNHPGQTDKDPVDAKEVVTQSNVLNTWEGLADRDLESAGGHGAVAALATGEGEVIYLCGVGSAGTVMERTWEGSTGTGTSERVMEGWAFLAQRYQEGDQIFLFGFSRGAYAVRSLAGFLNFAGLPSNPRSVPQDELKELFAAYREHREAPHADTRKPVRIAFIGVWDTVGSLAFGKTFNAFHQINPPNVDQVAHALALDEVRSEFAPSYWEVPAGASTQVRERWFAGAHTNVGGGYEDARLSVLAWLWMWRQAQAAGLAFAPGHWPMPQLADPLGEIRDSFSEFWRSIPILGEIVRRHRLAQQARQLRPGHLLRGEVVVRITQANPKYRPNAVLPHGLDWFSLPPDWVDPEV